MTYFSITFMVHRRKTRSRNLISYRIAHPHLIYYLCSATVSQDVGQCTTVGYGTPSARQSGSAYMARHVNVSAFIPKNTVRIDDQLEENWLSLSNDNKMVRMCRGLL